MKALVPPYLMSIKNEQIDLFDMSAQNDSHMRIAIGRMSDGDIRALITGKSPNDVIIVSQVGILKMRAVPNNVLNAPKSAK